MAKTGLLCVKCRKAIETFEEPTDLSSYCLFCDMGPLCGDCLEEHEAVCERPDTEPDEDTELDVE